MPATGPDEMKDAISTVSAQEAADDPAADQPAEGAGTDRAETDSEDDAAASDTADASDDEPAGERVDRTEETTPEEAVPGDPDESSEDESGAEEEPGAEDEPEPEPEEPTYQRFDCTGADFSAGAEAARLAIENGECVVLPTDTVYGIGADAFNADAVQRLLDAKERGRDMPPPVLIADTPMLKALATDIPQSALDLVERFWPGALTVICTVRENLDVDLGDMEGTIALRVPDHALTRDLLRETGPLAVSSANKTGRPSALSIDEAIDMLGNAVSVYLDGGRLADPADETGAASLPSTIVDFTHHEHGEVLRAGAISTEALQEVVPELTGPKAAKPLGSAADVSAAINALKASEPEATEETDSPQDEGSSEETGLGDGTEPTASTNGDNP